MANDLVHRLRLGVHDLDDEKTNQLLDEAAVEIERLRNLLGQIRGLTVNEEVEDDEYLTSSGS